ncbi:hypothetical protein CC86DRAFT_375414 [Ophiobolus disseminans]|uniref:F-box domain-containing protein n=1 Tax=Ophiobolus disseminans TaxID=1469910 RepID=A0A6A6ZE35_9PLEO|nr:hypothetical protein CC86DRAFT_375414 [Ophiobolus disseminans]
MTQVSTTKSTAPQVQNAAQQALQITELLENILLRLGHRNVLYNAQAVSPVWRNCITGSQPIKKSCLLQPVVADENTTEDKLYMSFADPLALTRVPQHIHDLFLQHLGTVNPSLANMRKFVLSDPSQNFDTYRDVIRTAFDHCTPEIDRFDVNCGPNAKHQTQIHQLRREALNPFLRKHLWPQNRCYWTGYGSHALLSIHGRMAEVLGGETGYPVLHRLINIMHESILMCATASWIDCTLTTPAVKTLTLCVPPFPFQRSLPTRPHHSQTVHLESGLYVRDALMLIADVAIDLFKEYEGEKIREIETNKVMTKWADNAYMTCEPTEEDRQRSISAVRKRMEPVISTAEDLQRLLKPALPVPSS